MSDENVKRLELDRERIRLDTNRALLAQHGEERGAILVQALETLGTWSGDPWAHRERIRKAMVEYLRGPGPRDIPSIANPKRRIEPLSSTLWSYERTAGRLVRGQSVIFGRDLHDVPPSFITTPRRIPAETILAVERLTLLTEGDPPLGGWVLELRRNSTLLCSPDLISLKETGIPLPAVVFDDRDDFILEATYHRQAGEERTANNRWRFGIRVDGWLAAPAYLTR